MTQQKPYPTLGNPPVIEAIISLGVELELPHTPESLKAVASCLKTTYPVERPWNIMELGLEIDEKGPRAFRQESQNGLKLFSEGEGKVLHLGWDSLSLNCLKPYTSWDIFSKDYREAWSVYIQTTKVKRINSLSVRYINQFQLEAHNWYEYLLIRPQLNIQSDYDDSMIALGAFSTTFQLLSQAYNASAIVNLNIQPEDSEKLQVTLDIEVQSQTSIKHFSGYHEIKDTFDRLRLFKNQIFFSNLPKAEEMFA